ncbi:hypothetical protein GCM10027051_00150 [Niabella terrae]
MRRLIVTLSLLLAVGSLLAQENPVNWSFSAKKVAANTFDIYMTAQLDKGWHIYSQSQPEDAIAIPTKFSYTRNPLVTVTGKTKELGKMEKFRDATLGISAHQYGNKVSFVQRVTVKSPAKTNLSGKVQYQVCDDKKCLPPKTVPFKVDLS